MHIPVTSTLAITEDLLLLATATVKSVKRCRTITELVVVWSVCSVCTSVTKSKVVGPHIQLDTALHFFLQLLQEVGKPMVIPFICTIGMPALDLLVEVA